MELIEAGNPQLKGVLPKVYARQNLDATVLGELIDLIGNIALGDVKARSADVLGHVFEYFLGEFALAEGKQGGQFYTPKSIVSLLVNMLEPYKGRVLTPAVALVVCSSSRKNLFKLIRVISTIFLSMVRNPTKQHGVWQR